MTHLIMKLPLPSTSPSSLTRIICTTPRRSRTYLTHTPAIPIQFTTEIPRDTPEKNSVPTTYPSPLVRNSPDPFTKYSARRASLTELEDTNFPRQKTGRDYLTLPDRYFFFSNIGYPDQNRKFLKFWEINCMITVKIFMAPSDISGLGDK